MSTKPQPKRTKHVPQRTCIGCQEVKAKRTLIRIVRTPGGIQIDPTGKLAGRGAYLHNQRSCWEQAIRRGAVARALKTELTEQDRDALQVFAQTLPTEKSDEPQQISL